MPGNINSQPAVYIAALTAIIDENTAKSIKNAQMKIPRKEDHG